MKSHVQVSAFVVFVAAAAVALEGLQAGRGIGKSHAVLRVLPVCGLAR